MPGISRATEDYAGSKEAVLIASQGTVFANKKAVIVNDDKVISHAPCGSPGGEAHCAAIMIAKTNKVFVGGIPVVNAGDLATCGHVATGSGDVMVGG